MKQISFIGLGIVMIISVMSSCKKSESVTGTNAGVLTSQKWKWISKTPVSGTRITYNSTTDSLSFRSGYKYNTLNSLNTKDTAYYILSSDGNSIYANTITNAVRSTSTDTIKIANISASLLVLNEIKNGSVFKVDSLKQ
jgi:hypothetical protein